MLFARVMVVGLGSCCDVLVSICCCSSSISYLLVAILLCIGVLLVLFLFCASLVFANGATPYTDLTLVEVVMGIKRQKVLPGPRNNRYPKEIYDRLMRACFVTNPALRPSFSELYDSAVHLGAAEDDVAVEENDVRQRRQPSAAEHLTADDLLERQGPSVFHLSTAFIRKAMKAIQKKLEMFDDLTHASHAKIYHMVEAFGKPTGINHICPRDGLVGASYVDTLIGKENVGVAKALLSYSWGYQVCPS
jgi:hypothetical protein